MIPKRKGKVTAVKRAGLASLYLGTPYVSTKSCGAGEKENKQEL
jgi:hypothetical protein